MSSMPFDRFDLFGSLALAFLFATSGAFDSMSVTPFPLRFGLWVAVVCPIGMGTGALVRYTLIRMKDGDEILTYVVAAMAAAVTSLLATMTLALALFRTGTTIDIAISTTIIIITIDGQILISRMGLGIRLS